MSDATDELGQVDGRIYVAREYVNEELAHRFHDTYERLAASFGYETRKSSAVSWDEVPAANKALMIATVNEAMGPILDAVAGLKRQRAHLRATLEWVQQHDHSHDAQLARVVAEGLRGEG